MSSEGWQSWITEMRRRLETPRPRRLPPTDARLAAVLVPLYVDGGDLWTLLTRRTDSVPHHKGQIAFPGGSLENREDAWSAAVREAEEEVGITGGQVLRLGQLDEAETPSGFRIVPCVGAVPFPFETEANPREIAEVFSLPLRRLADPGVVEERGVVVDGVARRVRVYHFGGRQIWGLTARILQNLLIRLDLEPEAKPN